MSWQPFRKVLESEFSKARCSKAAGLALIGLCVFLPQFYFFRELVAAELLLVLLILIPLFTFVGIVHTIGLVSDLGLDAIAVKVHSLPTLRRQRPL